MQTQNKSAILIVLLLVLAIIAIVVTVFAFSGNQEIASDTVTDSQAQIDDSPKVSEEDREDASQDDQVQQPKKNNDQDVSDQPAQVSTNPQPTIDLPTNWQQLTNEERITLNPHRCNLEQEVIRSDNGQCLAINSNDDDNDIKESEKNKKTPDHAFMDSELLLALGCSTASGADSASQDAESYSCRKSDDSYEVVAGDFPASGTFARAEKITDLAYDTASSKTQGFELCLSQLANNQEGSLVIDISDLSLELEYLIFVDPEEYEVAAEILEDSSLFFETGSLCDYLIGDQIATMLNCDIESYANLCLFEGRQYIATFDRENLAISLKALAASVVETEPIIIETIQSEICSPLGGIRLLLIEGFEGYWSIGTTALWEFSLMEEGLDLETINKADLNSGYEGLIDILNTAGINVQIINFCDYLVS